MTHKQMTVYKKPKQEWALVYIDDGRDSLEAVDLLQEKGYLVHPLRVVGNFGPRLLLGRRTFEGLVEIKRFLNGEH